MPLKTVTAEQPCARLRLSRRLGRRLPRRPAVDCAGVCAACPWNPAEQARRLAQGVWRRDKTGLLSLRFPPADKSITGDQAREGEENA